MSGTRQLLPREELCPELVTRRVGALEILTDSMEYEGIDRVLPIYDDEQPLICENLNISGNESVIDAGTGSGVLALFAASQGCSVLGIDILKRAVAVAELNSDRLGLQVEWQRGPYKSSCAAPNCADIVIFNAPHNPTPLGMEVAAHANGGEDGLGVFADFMAAAAVHIRPGGRIVFYQLTPSFEGRLKALGLLPRFLKREYSVVYSRVLPTVSYQWFLRSIYGDDYRAWQDEQVREYPDLDLVLGTVTTAGQGDIKVASPHYDSTASWESRVNLHRMIVTQAYRSPSSRLPLR